MIISAIPCSATRCAENAYTAFKDIFWTKVSEG